MLKVVSVVDKELTAIDRLARGMTPFMQNVKYDVVAVHPKRPDAEQLSRAVPLLEAADVIDWQYFRTAEMLRSQVSFKAKQILTHHNPYSITESDWNQYDMVVANNESIYENLGKITQSHLELIPNTVDTSFWTFQREWKPKNQAIMVANRIEAKKGIYEAALACKEAGLRLVLVGAVSDADYFHKVLGTGVVDFRQEITDEQLRELYWESKIHICNSVDNFESGTLPIIEAMLTGCPVVTRRIGHVPELNNNENMLIHTGAPDDIKGLVTLLKTKDETLNELRGKAWDTAKSRSHERRAYMYQKLYRQVMWPEHRSVSIVMPVCGNIDYFLKSAQAALDQDYPNVELIVVDDGYKEEGIEKAMEQLDSKDRLLRYIHTGKGDYGLARARNTGIIEATGEIIVFCDQRQVMHEDAVSKFIPKLAPRRWLYGNKGTKKEFVENFSCIDRDDIIRLGMFNERMDAWGGMSQEVRSRAKLQGYSVEFVEQAECEPLGSSKNKHTHRQDVIRMKNKLFKMGLQM